NYSPSSHRSDPDDGHPVIEERSGPALVVGQNGRDLVAQSALRIDWFPVMDLVNRGPDFSDILVALRIEQIPPAEHWECILEGNVVDRDFGCPRRRPCERTGRGLRKDCERRLDEPNVSATQPGNNRPKQVIQSVAIVFEDGGGVPADKPLPDL